MKALLDAMQFKQIMDGVKHAVSTDNSRPILGYIKLDIKGETITAYACDGFRLAKVVVTNTVHAASNKEEFIAYIKPLTVPKQTVDMIFPIEISKDDNIVTVSMQTGDGKTEFSFEQPNSEFVNAESAIAAALEHDREVAVNAAYIATAMKAIAKAITDKNNLAIMHSKADPTKAIIIKGEGEGIDITQLVLPVRMPNR